MHSNSDPPSGSAAVSATGASPQSTALARLWTRASLWLWAAGTLAAGFIAIFSLWAWAAGDWGALAPDGATVPVAPATAALLLPLVVALVLHRQWPGGTVVRGFELAVVALTAVVALVVLGQELAGFESRWTQWFVGAPELVRGIPIGRMSPFTAGVFFLAASSLLALQPALARRAGARAAGKIAALLGGSFCAITAVAYATGVPLFYGGGVVPMAFLTAIALLGVNLALLLAASADETARRLLPGGSAEVTPAPTEREQHLIIGLAAVALIAIGGGGLWFLHEEEVEQKDRIANELSEIATLKVRHIADWHQERLNDARLLRQVPHFARDLLALAANPQDSTLRADWRGLLEQMLSVHGYEAVALFDRDGNRLLATPDSADTSGPRLRELLQRLPGTRTVLENDIHRGPKGGVHLDFLAPVFANENDAPVGAIMMRVNAETYLFRGLSEWPVPSLTAETLLFRREGDEIVFINQPRHAPGPPLSLRRSVQDPHLLAAQVVRTGADGLKEGHDYRGARVLGAARAVPGLPWFVVAKVDLAEAYAPLRRQALIVIVATLAILAAAALGAGLLWRERTAEIRRRDSATEKVRSELTQRLALVTQQANDIIFLFDEQGRILEANERARASYGYTLEELRALPSGHLRAPAERPRAAADLARFGSPDGAQFETVHQRKDRTVFPVDVRGRAFASGGRRFNLAIVRDISERKRLEREMALREEQLSSFFKGATAGLALLDRNLCFVQINDTLAGMNGVPAAKHLGRTVRDVVPRIAPTVEPILRRVLDTGEPALNMLISGETPSHPGVRRQWMESFFPMTGADGRPESVGAIVVEITEHKQAEESLRIAHERLRRFVDANVVGIVIADATGRVIEANDYYLRLIGFSREEFQQGKVDWRAITPPEWLPADERAIRELRERGTCEPYEKEYLRRDGTRVKVYLADTILPGPEEQIAAFVIDITTQKQAEDALRESAALYRDTFEEAPVGILHTSRDGRFLRVNRRFCALLGYAPEELVGRSFQDVTLPEERDADTAALVRLHRGESAGYARDKRYLRKDGGTVWTRLSVSLHRNAAGQPEFFIAIVEDISERRQRESELRLFRALIDQTHEALNIIDPATGRYEDVNEGACRMLGYTRAELLSMSIFDVVVGLEPKDFEARTAQLRESGYFIFERRHRRKDGTLCPVEVSLSLVRLDREYLVTIAHDITTRKQREAQLNLVNTALRAAPNCIIITDARGTIEWVNPAFTHVTGYAAAEVIGQNPRLLKSGRQPPEFYADLWRTITSGQNWHGALINRRKDGTHYHEEATIAPVRDPGGAITHFVAIKQDISEKKKLEEQFLRAQRLESLGMLAAGIAHDLNNVLAPIGMAAPLLRVHASAPGDLRVLDTLEKCATRGAGLVKQILGFAHGVGGEPRVVQVKHLLRDIVQVVTETFPKSIALREHVPSDLWPVAANPTQIHQVLLNLCVNARDAMPDGGQLRLRGENCVLDDAAVAALETEHPRAGARPGMWLVLHVEDSGTGITPEVLARIWEPFFTTKSPDKGTGLGLSTVRGIVDAHHGFITVRTAPGLGSAFRVYLPAADQPASTGPHAAAAPADRGHGEHILLVDDEELIRDTAAVILRRAGYRVTTAADGAEAAVLFAPRSSEFALVVTDLDMPNLDGATLARVVRTLQPALKVLAMSGLASRQNKGSPTDFADAFLAKPFSNEALLLAIQQLLAPAAA